MCLYACAEFDGVVLNTRLEKQCTYVPPYIRQRVVCESALLAESPCKVLLALQAGWLVGAIFMQLEQNTRSKAVRG
jgi:hypothetical protein